MHFFVQRDRASRDHHTGAQQLPTLIQRHVGPIHYDQPLRHVFQPPLRQTPIQIAPRPVQGRISEQPIDTLQAVFEGDVMAEVKRDGRETGHPAAKQGGGGARERLGPLGMNPRQAWSQNSRYDSFCMHGTPRLFASITKSVALRAMYALFLPKDYCSGY